MGLVGYDSEMDELIITSKSDLQSPYAQLVRDHLLNKIGEQGLQQIKNYVAQNNCSLALEVCDIVNDPHIIEYPESNVYLLSIIDNTLDFKQKPYAEIVAFAQSVGLDYKKYYGQIHNAHEWLAFFQQDFGEIEGFVFEDAQQYMVKYKTPYYNFWKHKRSIIGLGRLTRNVQDLDREFYTFYLSNPDFKNMDIITLRKIFLKNKPPV